MRSLCPREDGRRDDSESLTGRFELHIHALTTHELHGCSAVLPAAPVPPEQGSSSNARGVQQDTHPAGLCRGAIVPLALLAQGTRTTLANASGIHEAQDASTFAASLLHKEGGSGWATQGPIGFSGKVLSREAPTFPGQGHHRLDIAKHRLRRVGSLLLRRQGSRGKLGRAHRLRLKLMPQLQADIPDPLRDDLPALLAQRGMRTPAIRVLYSKPLCKKWIVSIA